MQILVKIIVNRKLRESKITDWVSLKKWVNENIEPVEVDLYGKLSKINKDDNRDDKSSIKI